MQKNKTGKYLKYAIGEIVLVMIGILLALQINNWNEHRKDRIKELVILKQLKEDYQVNLIQLEQKMEMRNVVLKAALNIFKAIDHPEEIIRDSLIINIANVGNDPTFDPIQNDLVSSGNLRLITNEKLNRLLSNWSSEIVAVQELEVAWSQLLSQQYGPLIAKLGISRDVANSWVNDLDHPWFLDNDSNPIKTTIGTSRLSAPVTEIIASREIEGMVSSAITYNLSANVQSEALVKRIMEIIDLIENEIKEK